MIVIISHLKYLHFGDNIFYSQDRKDGKKILAESGLPILPADDLGDAAEKIVKAVQEAS